MAGSIPAWIQAFAALAVAIGAGIGAYHRYMVKPAKQRAEDAMSKARKAHQQAQANSGKVESMDDDLRDSLQDLGESLDDLVEGLERQRREARGRSYQLYVLSKAINEGEETPDVPVPDQDDFLRGGGGNDSRSRSDD